MIHSVHHIHGNGQMLDGGALFGTTPKTMWNKWLAADEHNRIPLACRCLLLESELGYILIEAGIGAFLSPKLKDRYGVVSTEHELINNLKSHGVHPDEIKYVVLSHLHFDHAGGLLTAYEDESTEFKLVFQNAQYICGDGSLARTQNPHAREKAMFTETLGQLLIASNQLLTVDTSSVADISQPIAAPGDLNGHIWFHLSNGHTAGMLLPFFNIGGQEHAFAADLIPGVAWVHQPITMGYDRFAELVVDEKTFFLEHLAKNHTRIHFYHDSAIDSGTINKNNNRFKCEFEAV